MPGYLKKAVVSIFLLVGIFLQNGLKVYADDNLDQFTINYDIKYEVLQDGVTQVTQQTSITNLKNDVIPTSYTFKAKEMEIYDITAKSNGKNTDSSKVAGDNETTVTVPFTNYAIGEGRTNTINLSYKAKGIASKVGDIWNLYIPGIQVPASTTLYNVVLSVPESLGPKIYVSPSPTVEKLENGSNTYYFTKESLNNKGITASFGKYQELNFNIKYQLQNNWIIGSIFEVALPPDIQNIQQVYYDTITPAPRRIKVDKDGNSIALFWLGPKSKKEITVKGSAKILSRQINPDFGGEMSSIPSTLISEFTKPQKYWEAGSDQIKELAETLFDKNQNVTQNAKNVYNYITKNLTYDFDALDKDSVERYGALAAYTQKGSWTCMEFTDLFVATARAMGIPAKEINGYAFTSDSAEKPVSISLKGGDLLHSWAEYYDPVFGWVQIDPTWGATSGVDYFTKLDTNHFAFVVKGENSEFPYPAGAYRFSDSEKLVDVDFSQTGADETFNPDIEVKKVFNFNPIQLLQGNNKYSVLNKSGYFIYNLQGKVLPPGQKTYIYLSKETNSLSFDDFKGTHYVKNF